MVLIDSIATFKVQMQRVLMSKLPFENAGPENIIYY